MSDLEQTYNGNFIINTDFMFKYIATLKDFLYRFYKGPQDDLHNSSEHEVVVNQQEDNPKNEIEMVNPYDVNENNRSTTFSEFVRDEQKETDESIYTNYKN